MFDDELLEPAAEQPEMEEAFEIEDVSETEDVLATEEAPALEEPANAKAKGQDAKKTTLTYLHDLVYLLAVVLALFLLCFRVVVVSGPSMNDTLKNGDYLLLLNGIFFRDYQCGDVIVASKDAFRDGEPIIKRVIATEGQTVDIDFDNGIVYVDGKALDEPYTSSGTYLPEGVEFPLVVKENHIFVLGDNRMNSKDSRSTEIGQIDCREVLGKAIFLIFPGTDGSARRELGRIGVVK